MADEHDWGVHSGSSSIDRTTIEDDGWPSTDALRGFLRLKERLNAAGIDVKHDSFINTFGGFDATNLSSDAIGVQIANVISAREDDAKKASASCNPGDEICCEECEKALWKAIRNGEMTAIDIALKRGGGRLRRRKVKIIFPGIEPSSQLSAVDHPSHYGGAENPYEAIKVIEAWSLGFCLGNAVKYIARNGKKTGADAVEDLKKARWYLDREIARMEK